MLIVGVTITLGTLAQGRLGNTIFYLSVVEKAGSTEWGTIKMLRRCSKCFGHLAKWLENRKGESNSNLLLRLGVGGPQFFHYFLVVCMYISLGSPEKQNQTNRISLSLSLSPPPLPLSLSYKELSEVIVDTKKSQKSIVNNLEI